jgi:hypothetical protein
MSNQNCFCFHCGKLCERTKSCNYCGAPALTTQLHPELPKLTLGELVLKDGKVFVQDESGLIDTSDAQRVAELVKERDKAIGALARLKDELQAIQSDGFDEHFRPTYVRAEPSRLEIAAMFMSAQIAHHGLNWSSKETLRQAMAREAGELIDAVKEGK